MTSARTRDGLALLLGAALALGAAARSTACQQPATEPDNGSPPAAADGGSSGRFVPGRRLTAARCREHLAAAQERIPPGFAAVVEPPFVVIAEGAEPVARRHAERTVRWATDLLRRDFFADDPAAVLEVWLFDGNDSYRKHARALFGDQPTTRYGYYSARHGALIMDIATGGGTLVHELVHPFVQANVRGCPAWCNEGLGSLFEQCSSRGGHIVGSTNWRLDGLQRAIRAGQTVPLTQLIATTDAEFYGARSGLHYAMARYLLYWLQERGVLRGFWQDMTRTRAADRSGRAALLRALQLADDDELAAFQDRWEAWVLTLQR